MKDIIIYEEDNAFICEINNTYLDFDNVFNLNDRLRTILDKNRQKLVRVILDLKHLKTIDSNGIAFLMIIKNKVEEINGKIALINVSEFLQKTFSYIDIKQYFNMYSTKQEAKDYLFSDNG